MLSYRQKTNLTTLGIFREGFLVSPAVMPKLSVPPTIWGQPENQLWMPSLHTCKACCDEYVGEPSKTPDKWCTRYPPIATTDVPMLRIDSSIDNDASYSEDYDGHNF